MFCRGFIVAVSCWLLPWNTGWGPKGNIHPAAHRGFFSNKKMTKIESAVLELERGFKNIWIRKQLQLSLIHLTHGMGSVLGLGEKSWNPIDLCLKNDKFAEQVLFMNQSGSH